MTRHEIVTELLKLSAEERREIAQELWDSIAAESLTDEQAAEIERRMLELEENPSVGIPWEQVRTTLRKTSD